jgi:hypothetical protein
MPSAALCQLESLLHARKLGATLSASMDAPAKAVASSGIASLDRRIQGGWPLGALSEVVGPRSTGRMHVLVSTMAAASRQGHVVALVDAFDRFDPRSASAAGLDVDRLLWIRGAALTVELARPAMLEHALLLAIRAFDLVLRAGGFGVVALDLCDASPRVLRGLPSATWFRLSHVNEGRPTAALLLGDAPMGRSAQGLSVRLQAQPLWTGGSAQSHRFAGLTIDPSPVGRIDYARQVS